jgi:hypothetical protein
MRSSNLSNVSKTLSHKLIHNPEFFETGAQPYVGERTEKRQGRGHSNFDQQASSKKTIISKGPHNEKGLDLDGCICHLWLRIYAACKC